MACVERPWIDDGEQKRCTRHDAVFPRSHVCPGCITAPAIEVVDVDTTVEDAYRSSLDGSLAKHLAQRERWIDAELELLRASQRDDLTSRDVAAFISAAATAADISRKAGVAHDDLAKLLHKVEETKNKRLERTRMRKGRGH